MQINDNIVYEASTFPFSLSTISFLIALDRIILDYLHYPDLKYHEQNL